MFTKRDFDEADKKYYFSGRLGAVYSPKKTVFRVWAPFADGFSLKLYHSGDGGKPFLSREMKKRGGVWETTVSGDLAGVYYTFVSDYGGRLREAPDIYAVSSGVDGRRSMVLPPLYGEPEGFRERGYCRCDPPSDAVICELHVRDYSSDKSAGFVSRGKFAAFCERDVKNSFGDAVGLDHFSGLGVTHIHLLPVWDFSSVDERAEFPAFNWGYDPFSYNAPEGSYSSDPRDGRVRVRELKALVDAIHKKGMGVIFDVVYNHTADAKRSAFSAAFPHYYYRHFGGRYSGGSGCGNELATERLMVRRFIADSLCRITEEYLADGFRFDLMGLIDCETLNYCARRLKRINPDILLYGEGWTGGRSPLDESRMAVKKNARRVRDYAMFSDDFRDGAKGSVFSDEDCGYINGAAAGRAELMKSALCGGVYHPQVSRDADSCWTDSPVQAINYVECHDNLTFYDKLRVSMPEAPYDELLAVNRLGAALIFLAQGIPFIQAGQDFQRSKRAPDGSFVHDSYKSPDEINGIKWDELHENRALSDYYKGLIALRKKFPCLRLGTGGEVRKTVSFSDLGGGAFMMTAGNLRAAINPLSRPIKLTLKAPAAVYADDSRAGADQLYFLMNEAEVKPHSVLVFEYL